MNTDAARILIVDDEAASLRALLDILGERGYHAVGCGSGRDALQLLRDGPFDLLLSDLMMPEMDGVELLGEALKLDPQLVGILMTGMGTIATAVKAMQAGALDYVLKPIKLNTLLPVLARALGVRRLRLENLALRDQVAIHELNQAIAHTLDPAALLERIIDAAMAQFDGDNASIMLLAEDGRHLEIAAVRGAGRESLRGTLVPIGQGAAGWVAAHQMPRVLQGSTFEPACAPLFPLPAIQSALSIPMSVRNRLVGVLNVSCIRRRQTFADGQIQLFGIFTSAAAASLEMTRLNELRHRADARFREVLQIAADAIVSFDKDLRIVLFNPAAERIFGWVADQAIGQPLELLIPHGDGADNTLARQIGLFANGEASGAVPTGAKVIRARRRDGTGFMAEVSSASDIQGGERVHTAVIRDITSRVLTERKIARLSRIQALRGNFNAAVVRSTKAQELYDQACQLAIDHGGFHMAWIGLAGAHLRKVHPAASSGAVAGFLDEVGQRLAQSVRDESAVGRALRTGQLVVVNDTALLDEQGFGPQCLARGYRSMAAFALLVQGQPHGVMALYSAEPGFFDTEELGLLSSMATELALALEVLQTRTQLFETTETFRSLVSIAPVGILRADKDGRCNFVNRAWSEISGMAQAQAMGSGWTQAIHPEDVARVRNDWLEARRLRKYGRAEYRFQRPDGSVAWVVDTSVEIADASGAVIGYLRTASDITPQKKTEAVLRALSTESAGASGIAMLQILARQLAQALGMDFGFVGRIDGEQGDAVQTLAIWDGAAFLPNSRYALRETPCQDAVSSGLCVLRRAVQHSFPHDRMVVDLNVSAYAAMPLLSTAGHVLGLLGVMHREPIDEQLDVESMIKLFATRAASEIERQNDTQRFADLFEYAPDATLIMNNQGIIEQVNRQAESLFGWTRVELLGQPITQVIPRSLHDERNPAFDRHTFSGPLLLGAGDAALSGARRDNSRFPIEVSLSPVQSDRGTMVVAAVRDITERRRLEDELHQLNDGLEAMVLSRTVELEQKSDQLEQQTHELVRARELAEAANEAKSAFLATMSHEIRTPMNGVVGMIDVLAQSRLSEHQLDAVQTIRTSAFTLLHIIDDVLDFSKIEAGKLELEHAPVDLVELIEGICCTLHPVALDKDVELNMFIDPGVPEHILSDATRLRQVLYNLLGNAIKFSAGRAQQGHVRLLATMAADTPEHLLLRIADNGIGMASEVVDRLFSAFTQADVATTRRFGGSGLGLAICKRLVTLMEGTIDAQSRPGHGSAFVVKLPIVRAPMAQPRRYPAIDGQHCIVVGEPRDVDDLCSYLEHAKAQLHRVADPLAAAQCAQGLHAPVVIHVLGNIPFSAGEIVAPFAGSGDVRHLAIARGRRRSPRLVTPDMLMLDGECMRRATLLRAVAVAAGRLSPESLPDDAPQDSIGEHRPAPSVAVARELGQLILVAEDDEVNKKVILRQLEVLGHAAEVASNGVEALAMWRGGRYALLLSDLHMPEMDGYTLARTIRSEEHQLGRTRETRMPILALTANALRGEALRAQASGMDEYLTKPIQLDMLKAALRRWLPSAGEAGTAEPGPRSAAGAGRMVHDTALLDIGVLQRLVGNDPKTVREFLVDYRDALEHATLELQRAVAASDLGRIGAIVHRLKSSSRSVGALAIGKLCTEIEGACIDQLPAAVLRAAQRWQHQHEATMAQLGRALDAQAR